MRPVCEFPVIPAAISRPMRLTMLRFLLFLLPILLSPGRVVADPVISEFSASNQNGLQDEDGDRPDWIEIHNPDPAPAVLTNWYLTDESDQRTKWRFPAVTIPAGGYLVVFASGKDRRVPGQPLHTDFSLSTTGEYLGLIRPNGITASSQFQPTYPAQFPDLSYGLPSNIVPVTFVAQTSACQWIVPSSATAPASTWRDLGFVPSGWNSATQGIGYDRNTSGVNFLPEIGTGGNVDAALYNIRTSCYLRIPFTIAAGGLPQALKLRLKYDDGFVAWLNGQPLMSGAAQLRRNAPPALAWDSAATATNEDAAAVVFEEFDVSESAGLLVEGQNVLAFQTLNRSLTSSDFLFRAELAGEVTAGPAPSPGYFSTPTPGARNSGVSGTVIPQQVVFSRASGTFTSNFNLTLSGAVAGQQIRYTTDGSLPGPSSTLYTGSIAISSSTLVRARILSTTSGALGFAGAASYERLDTTLSNYAGSGQPFRSALPIVVLNNRGGGEIGDPKEIARLQVHDRDASGYATLGPSSVPVLDTSVLINIRGRSSASFPKKSYGIELLGENDATKVAAVLGMPPGEDWALVGCYNFDRAFMRNAWIYEMSRQAGAWSPRTRLVEVFFNQDGGTLAYGNADYRGVYILCETIRRGADRVDVAELEPSQTSLPDVSGGYIFKVDSPEPDEFSWKTSRNLPPAGTGGDNLVIHRPKLADLSAPQSTYLRDAFQAFEDAVFTEAAGGFATRNYRNSIDSKTWVQHNLLCTLAKNVDALRLSAYYYKDRSGKLAGGPLWDFDRSVNSTDTRDDNPSTWLGTGDGTNFFTFAWWQPLFQDAEFRQLWVDRWRELRRGTLSTANVNSVLDGYLAEFKPADADNPSTRDYLRWYGSATSNNITTETTVMKNWLSTRSAWIDSQFTALPVIVRPSGPVTAGLTTTITVPSGTTVYYTVDGSDPRALGGGISSSALVYNGTPVPIPSTRRVIARAWRSGTYEAPATNWSGPVEALYLVGETFASAASLRVSGLNYNPLAPSAAEAAAMPEATAADFEWIELSNVSAAPVNLQGVSLAEGMPVAAVTLPPFTLAAGARALVVKNPAAFQLRYGPAAAARIAGQWSGDGNLSNGGETIVVRDRNNGLIASFAYDDEGDWPERADGSGAALVYVGSGILTADYQNPLLWDSSDAVHGSPGLANPFPPSSVVVNEILARAVSPQLDLIELHNAGPAPVAVGGWFLGNAPAAVSEDDYRQFRIPDGTVIPAGGFLVFDESDFNPNGEWNPAPGPPGEGEFSLDGARGGDVWLISADPVSGKLRNFEQKAAWTPVLPGLSYGRWPDGSGSLAPLAEFTPSTANALPRVGPVQLTEIHYHPSGTTPEFVEISNTSAVPEALDGWTLRGTVDFDFPAGFTIQPAEAVVLVAFDPVLLPAQAATFRSLYGVAPGVRLIGPWLAPDTLTDAGGTVRLRRKVPPPADEPGFVGLMIEDEVNYLAQAPWPVTASGTGSSIRRLGVRRQGSDPAAWTAGAPGPGGGVGGYAAWKLAEFGSGDGGGTGGDPDADGLENFIEYLLGTDPTGFNTLASGIDRSGPQPRFVLNYSVRTDRDDGVLTAAQSGALGAWSPAVNDELISTNGLTQQRRAWLPLAGRGFLRLEAEEVP